MYQPARPCQEPVRLGDFDKATGVFRTMAAQKDPSLETRGRRSLALLDMYLGRYAAAANTRVERRLEQERKYRLNLAAT